MKRAWENFKWKFKIGWYHTGNEQFKSLRGRPFWVSNWRNRKTGEERREIML